MTSLSSQIEVNRSQIAIQYLEVSSELSNTSVVSKYQEPGGVVARGHIHDKGCSFS